jgi:DNA repair exonuclease SbcCD ATPase subunit
MVNVLRNGNDKYTHVLQFGDVHLRLNQRLIEYREVFSKLYAEIKNTPTATVVVCTGDVFHNKADLSAECVQMAADLFKSISDIRPFVVISGNHDALLSNKSRLDSLTPIVEALNHKNLYYLKKSGLFGFGNILFNNYSVFDDVEHYLPGDKIPKVYINQYEHLIALFHGPVDNSLTDLGYKISNKSYPITMFDGHHISLLGDIHKGQDLQHYNGYENKPAVRYASSLIQQNHGETLDNHGISLWDLATKSYKHIEMPNDYGYFTVELNKGKLVTDISNIPKKARVRIKCFETVATEVKAAVTLLRKKVDINEVTYIRVDSPNDKGQISTNSNVSLGDLTNVDYQNKLITNYIKNILKIDDKVKIDEITKLNAEINQSIEKDNFARNIRWKPKRFEFDNMFSYGEGNIIDFSKLKDVVGLFANNASGKSSILDALTFCIYDKSTKAFKASEIINTQKMSFRCKFNFEINGVDYFIERKGLMDKKGNVKVDVKFWKEENGTETPLNGEARRSTNDIIREYLGTYDDFILTSMSVQNVKNVASFIDMGNTEKKDLLAQFMGLNIFDKLFEHASKRNNEVSVLLRTYKNDDFTKKLIDTHNNLQIATSTYESENSQLSELSLKKEDVQSQILEETKKLIKIDGNIPNDIGVLDETKSNLSTDITDYTNNIERYASEKTTKENELLPIDSEIKEIDKLNIDVTMEKYNNANNELRTVQFNIGQMKVEIKNKLEKLQKLKEHKYDPNCKFCVENIFVKDAIKTQAELMDDKIRSDEMIAKLEMAKKEKESLEWVVEKYEKYNDLISNRNKVKSKINALDSDINKTNRLIEKTKRELDAVNNNIELYHQNQEAILTNSKINGNISELKTKLNNTDFECKQKNKVLMDLNGKITLWKSQIEDIKSKVDKAKLLETQNECYELYLQSVGRDGIPYIIIANTVPEIEREVNNILTQIAEFHAKFEIDGKNVIPYIVYDDKKWPMLLASGFEKFVCSLAIRVALINVSNLPRTNFLVCDEGFGVLDADNLTNMHALFHYLKTIFDFILIISHLDSLKDSVDSHIEIKKENGFSKVSYV